MLKLKKAVLGDLCMANTNSKLYTNKEMARICSVSEASMSNLIKALELAPIKMGKYGRKYYDISVLKQVKRHYSNKANSTTNNKKSNKKSIIQAQQAHINDLERQVDVLNQQLKIKDSQISAQLAQIKQNTVLLSQAHTLTLQAQTKTDPDKDVSNTKTGPQNPVAKNKDSHGLIWKIFH